MLLVTAKLSCPALPEELWVDILCNLSYFDLKRLKRTSQTFRLLLRLPALARRLFKARPTKELARAVLRTKQITLHPLFDLVACPPEIDYHSLELDDSEDVLSELNARKEMATNPPLKKVVVVLGGIDTKAPPILHLSNDHGVQVGQVYRKVVQLAKELKYSELQGAIHRKLNQGKREKLLTWRCDVRVTPRGRVAIRAGVMVPPRAALHLVEADVCGSCGDYHFDLACIDSDGEYGPPNYGYANLFINEDD